MGNEKQLIFKLKQIQTNEIDDGADSKTYHFKPINKDLEKHITLKISQAIESDIISKLGMPIEKGDTIIIELGAKETQSKLILSEEKTEETPTD